MFDEQSLRKKITLHLGKSTGEVSSSHEAPGPRNHEAPISIDGLPDQFIVLSVIGQGGMGTVYSQGSRLWNSQNSRR